MKHNSKKFLWYPFPCCKVEAERTNLDHAGQTAGPITNERSQHVFQSASNVELNKLSAKIAELEKEIKKLRAENEILQKVKSYNRVTF